MSHSLWALTLVKLIKFFALIIGIGQRAAMLCGWEGNVERNGSLAPGHLRADCLEDGIGSGPSYVWITFTLEKWCRKKLLSVLYQRLRVTWRLIRFMRPPVSAYWRKPRSYRTHRRLVWYRSQHRVLTPAPSVRVASKYKPINVSQLINVQVAAVCCARLTVLTWT